MELIILCNQEVPRCKLLVHVQYGREDTLQPGTQVRLHSLETSNLNNKTGTADCFDSTKARYRVVLENLSAGLFKRNNLERLDFEIDFTELNNVNFTRLMRVREARLPRPGYHTPLHHCEA